MTHFLPLNSPPTAVIVCIGINDIYTQTTNTVSKTDLNIPNIAEVLTNQKNQMVTDMEKLSTVVTLDDLNQAEASLIQAADKVNLLGQLARLFSLIHG